MGLIGAALLLAAFASGAVAAPCADNPCYADFKDIPGISSLCNNAVRPTTTIDVTVTAPTTVTTTVTAPYYRYTVYSTTSSRPTALATCSPAAQAGKAAPAVGTAAEAGLIKSRTVTGHAQSPTLAPRAEKCCPPVKEGLSKACRCFFPAGPQQTATHTVTKADYTYTTTVTTTSFDYHALTKTIVAGCAPSEAPVWGSASYAVCGSQGIPVADTEECPVNLANGTAPAFTVLSEDCCSACANTKDCFQAYTDPASNTCRLDIRRKADTVNHNVTTDCPNAHTFVSFGNEVGVENGGSYYSGFLSGHCAQGC